MADGTTPNTGVAAAEAAIGLAILVVLFRNRRTIDVEDLDALKG
jgi:NADH-quinone oxidoreductase subunit K